MILMYELKISVRKMYSRIKINFLGIFQKLLYDKQTNRCPQNVYHTATREAKNIMVDLIINAVRAAQSNYPTR